MSFLVRLHRYPLAPSSQMDAQSTMWAFRRGIGDFLVLVKWGGRRFDSRMNPLLKMTGMDPGKLSSWLRQNRAMENNKYLSQFQCLFRFFEYLY